MRGLVIKSPWVDLILDGKKVWEIRGSNTKIRGTVGLIKSGSGTVVGTVKIVDSQELTLSQYRNGSARHGVESEASLQLPYKRTYAWVLEDPVIYQTPRPYKHPMGAVIWVDLSKAMEGKLK
ncbi:ASCH domain-containing protein [Bacillus sp. KH172YL63]|uniref:ASCH domain-containing protein n=1 Tax=Bacillus sp. KH172YL63 TaxID=2709784 RepID=UPI0013E42FFF|nr:ASCH domain-containing protein [Bacillus sp. KH172YL63]BCB02541.1 RNA-binding protein [Bacillus sp. KH172YL63]